MAQDDNKLKPELPGRNGDERNSKKTPRFSIYWIYALIAVGLIGFQYYSSHDTSSSTTTLQEFQKVMLAQGDVKKLELIKNKELVRVYILHDSLVKKPFYQIKLSHIAADTTSPQFEFQVT